MCGIFAYIGTEGKNNAPQVVFSGLKRLEYRGYDSWGIAALGPKGIVVNKKIGKLGSPPEFLGSYCAAGHTRWATHGGVTHANAHPHVSFDGSFALVHNGIVENFQELKKLLEKKGHKFISETDTEVIVRLVEDNLKTTKDLAKALRLVYSKLQGRNTVLVLTRQGQVFGVRNGSPLILGASVGGGSYYLSSDTYSFADKVSAIYALDNTQMATIQGGHVMVTNIASGKSVPFKMEKLDFTNKNVHLGKYRHYMEKEIYDTPECLTRLTEIADTRYMALVGLIRKAKTVYCIGSGTAANAAAQTAFFIREYSGINAIGLIGADCREYWGMFSKDDVIIALSQSGETADVVEVLEVAKQKSVKIVSLVNMPGSMITRMSDLKFMANAGPEICVMSTKVFVSQIAWGYLVAKSILNPVKDAKEDILGLAKVVKKLLADKRWLSGIKATARYLSTRPSIFLLGKAGFFYIVKEGMVKIIEGSYIHAHAIPAGDLKHYAITLIETGVDVMAVVPVDNLRDDVLSSLNQVKARGAVITAISPINDTVFDNWLEMPNFKETASILSILPLQLLAYYMAVYLGNNVDKPRNIAKSVTVK